MNDSLTLGSPSLSLSTLPPELLDEILSQTSLSKSDLAQCCLVSRQFLRSSLPTLYRSATFKLRPAFRRYTIERSSQFLLETLRSSPKLRISSQLVVQMLFPSSATSSTDSQVEPSELVIEILQLLPRLNQVSLLTVEVAGLDAYLTSQGPRWKKSCLDYDLDPFEFDEESPFTNLEELSCCLGMTKAVKRVYLPPLLQKLKTFCIDSPLVIIENASTSTLRSLHLSLSSLFKLQNVPHLLHLIDLWVEFGYAEEDGALAGVSSIANTVQTCHSLVSLSLRLVELEQRPLIEPFPRQPPPSLRRLSFLEVPPLFDALLPILDSGSLNSVQTIWIEEPESQSSTQFTEVCRRKSIKVEFNDEKN